MCVTNPNQGKVVAQVFFVEQNKLSTLGQNSHQYSKIIFSAKIKVKRIPIAYYTAQHMNIRVMLLHSVLLFNLNDLSFYE